MTQEILPVRSRRPRSLSDSPINAEAQKSQRLPDKCRKEFRRRIALIRQIHRLRAQYLFSPYKIKIISSPEILRLEPEMPLFSSPLFGKYRRETEKVRADLSRHRDRLLRVPVVIAQLGFLFSEFESHEYIPNFVQNSPSNVNSCLTPM